MEMQKGANPQYLEPVPKSFIAQLHAPKRAESQNQLTPELTPASVDPKTSHASVHRHALVSIAVGPIKDMLTEEVRRLRADVLVMGRSPQSGAVGRLRDLSYALVRDAPCPVLSV
jgi:nucleotide-binding universal stress UspA family protein